MLPSNNNSLLTEANINIYSKIFIKVSFIAFTNKYLEQISEIKHTISFFKIKIYSNFVLPNCESNSVGRARPFPRSGSRVRAPFFVRPTFIVLNLRTWWNW